MGIRQLGRVESMDIEREGAGTAAGTTALGGSARNPTNSRTSSPLANPTCACGDPLGEPMDMGTFAVLALIVIGLCLMIRKVTPAEALKYGAGFVGIAVVLIQLMKVLVCFWCSMAHWQQVLLFVAPVVFWLWRQKSLPPLKGKDR